MQISPYATFTGIRSGVAHSIYAADAGRFAIRRAEQVREEPDIEIALAGSQ
jgi:hypothetical protein